MIGEVFELILEIMFKIEFKHVRELWDLGFYWRQTADVCKREDRSKYAPLCYSSCQAETIYESWVSLEENVPFR